MVQLNEHFSVEGASAVRWAHAVNSVAEQEEALADEAVHMLEADLLMAPPKTDG
jgi:hypothetical protein